MTSFRHADILEIARTEGKVTVEDLAERFEVTVQTIRRDLSDLAEAGRLERVHGGAVLASGVSNIGYEQRRRLHSDSKSSIARACAEAIPNECSVFLNIGTTTEAVARELIHHENLVVITNNINVANILAENASCEIVVAGGVLRRSDFGLVGDLAAEAIARFKVDIAVIGCSALDGDGDLLDFDIQEVSVSRKIIAQARETYLVADGSKFQRSAPVRIASLREVDQFFTDAPLTKSLAAACASWGTKTNII
ncbi:MAG: DeoR/GlpR family DNA-binding transcription regulator [Mangrovicoccus sp.]|nr:DeoR/GlpR family DNA-binding transcription regulator [Mangrovicoccus sp.]